MCSISCSWTRPTIELGALVGSELRTDGKDFPEKPSHPEMAYNNPLSNHRGTNHVSPSDSWKTWKTMENLRKRGRLYMFFQKYLLSNLGFYLDGCFFSICCFTLSQPQPICSISLSLGTGTPTELARTCVGALPSCWPCHGTKLVGEPKTCSFSRRAEGVQYASVWKWFSYGNASAKIHMFSLFFIHV